MCCAQPRSSPRRGPGARTRKAARRQRRSRGSARRASRPGNASHYYSLTRMPTRGSLTIEGERFDVTGSSWMDHEFGTSFLEPSQQGWDWLSLQLEDGTDLMLYQLRASDGRRDRHSSGTLIRPNGSSVHLGVGDFVLEPSGPTFASRATGARYPIAWRVSVPGHGITLAVSTPLADQEFRTGASTGISVLGGSGGRLRYDQGPRNDRAGLPRDDRLRGQHGAGAGRSGSIATVSQAASTPARRRCRRGSGGKGRPPPSGRTG